VSWQSIDYSLGFYLGDRRLFSKQYSLYVCDVGLTKHTEFVDIIKNKPVLRDSQDGYMIRSLPVERVPRKLEFEDGFIRYTPSISKRYYAQLDTDYDTYLKSFSPKTRSTIRRKVKKFSEYSNGGMSFKEYRTATELDTFFKIAAPLSSKTYQENLLEAGLPTSDSYKQKIMLEASANKVRAYLLFNDDKAVAYLFLTASGDTLLYSYLGYDPSYMKWSVGTVLNWLALESLFAEKVFSILDFTDGESQQKQIFSTGSITCANTFFIRKSVLNQLVLIIHIGVDRLSSELGNLLNKLGLKARIRKLMRHGL
jgi:CelD/BcsL family acetyltransferase involved in cellulose biosynthesis